MKTKEELNKLKEEVNNVNEKLQELTPEELEQVNGGARRLTVMGDILFVSDTSPSGAPVGGPCH